MKRGFLLPTSKQFASSAEQHASKVTLHTSNAEQTQSNENTSEVASSSAAQPLCKSPAKSIKGKATMNRGFPLCCKRLSTTRAEVFGRAAQPACKPVAKCEKDDPNLAVHIFCSQASELAIMLASGAVVCLCKDQDRDAFYAWKDMVLVEFLVLDENEIVLPYNVFIPATLKPFRTAIAQEKARYKMEKEKNDKEKWNPWKEIPGKPMFRFIGAYQGYLSIRLQQGLPILDPCQAECACVVIIGLLQILHPIEVQVPTNLHSIVREFRDFYEEEFSQDDDNGPCVMWLEELAKRCGL